ncbi:MAG: hypothetical protein WCY41_00660 [Candidatus Micrarchaeia archaeon]
MEDESGSQSQKVAIVEKDVREIQVHIILGCSDARDISGAYFGSMKKMLEKYRADGILVDVERLSVAGTFATQSTIAEIKSKIFEKVREYYEYDVKDVKITFFVHVNAHGDAHLKDGAVRERHSMHDIEVVPGSSFNCGMMNAHIVAEEMERLLLDAKPTLKFKNSVKSSIRIDSEAKIKDLLKNFYGFNGGSIVNWIKPIYDLRIHANDQKGKLREAFDNDPVISHLGVHITAGIQNYATNEYLRVDGNTHIKTFLDDVYANMRESGVPSDYAARVSKQEPLIGCWHKSDFQDARKTVADFYIGDQYAAGQVFAIGSAMLDQNRRPLGAYQLGSYFYGITHLKLQPVWPVLCKQEREAQMASTRIMNDSLGGFFTSHFNIRLPLTYRDGGQGLIAPAELRNAASKAKLPGAAGCACHVH